MGELHYNVVTNNNNRILTLSGGKLHFDMVPISKEHLKIRRVTFQTSIKTLPINVVYRQNY